jgi:hypothetical protein
LQLGPWLVGTQRLRCAGQIPATTVAGGKGEPARKVQGTRAVLARGDVQVGVGRRDGTVVNRGAAMELNHGDGVPA